MSDTAIERLTSRYKIDDNGCWIWQGSFKGKGYGQFWLDGKSCLAHRVSYTLLVGDIPNGLQIDHLCNNRACINPEHLEPVSCQENITRSSGPEKSRQRQLDKTHCRWNHPYDEINTRYTKQGYRKCRECLRRYYK